MPAVNRRYDDPCGIARALDAVGERWSLLVVRELVFGPKRFGDLRRGLAGVSPNVLSQRLTELERDGVLRHRSAGPPISAAVYELTPAGHDLIPVLDALSRWGRQRPIRTARPLSLDALMFALQSTVNARASVPAGLRLILDGTAWDPVIARGSLHWRPAGRTNPTATLETSAATLQRLVFRGLDLHDAVAAGEAVANGDLDVIRAFLTAFSLSGVDLRADPAVQP